jgi:hypothetical protein
MDRTLHRGIKDGFLTVYMDDILIHSRNIEEHAGHLEWTLTTLRDKGFKLNPEKCVFGLHEVEFLGHLISGSGIKPKPDKLDTIQNLNQRATSRNCVVS